MEYSAEYSIKHGVSTAGWNWKIKAGSNRYSVLISMFFRGLTFWSVLGFVMSFVYAGLGTFLLISDNVLNFSGFQQSGLGLILLAYGIFRFYTTLKKQRENELEDDDE